MKCIQKIAQGKDNIEEKVTQNEMHKDLKIRYKQGDINNLQRIRRMKASLYLKSINQSSNRIVKILLTWPEGKTIFDFLSWLLYRCTLTIFHLPKLLSNYYAIKNTDAYNL